MKLPNVRPTQRERSFRQDNIIVSKTDPKGLITYVNQTFVEVSGYTEEELLGQPHNIIRHPDMPRCVFKLLWDTLAHGDEIFAYVKNMCKNGDFYWVFAHVTPTFGRGHHIIGYHSNRRLPDRHQITLFEGIYAKLLAEEKRYPDWHRGMEAAGKLLMGMVAERNMAYEEFIFSV